MIRILAIASYNWRPVGRVKYYQPITGRLKTKGLRFSQTDTVLGTLNRLKIGKSKFVRETVVYDLLSRSPSSTRPGPRYKLGERRACVWSAIRRKKYNKTTSAVAFAQCVSVDIIEVEKAEPHGRLLRGALLALLLGSSC